MSATTRGFEIHFTRALASDRELTPKDFELSDWFYVPSEIYGGPKYDVRELEVETVTLSSDRRVASITVPDRLPGRVVYLHLDASIRSQRNETLWVNEAWYTMNVLPTNAQATPMRAPLSGPAVSGAPPNTLSRAEEAAGWRLLFDGRSFEGWKIYGAEDDSIEFWEIQEGAIAFTRDVSFAGLVWNHLNPFTPGSADLMTKERFGDFELSIDWRISPGGNSGIFYLVPDESSSLAWDLGLEMQVLDDDGHSDGQIDHRRAGNLYDLQALARDVARPVGEWNTARIRVRGDHLEHWLNGHRLVDIRRGSPEWQDAIATSKFADNDKFGMATRGHITLQDHGDLVWYRNVKIRELPLGETR